MKITVWRRTQGAGTDVGGGSGSGSGSSTGRVRGEDARTEKAEPTTTPASPLSEA